ncbi:MAG TPA: elongation factor G [Firmicutes bacterium]|nr:elongation factor G [Bacillota bacterium]HBE06444.1 elongation factor G [Bacillota bacterium]HBR23976.1 elongation factor G [Bacillota bacterium]HCF89374.1 elongation factor G [Bacillota bacterium]HCF91455.1 elongation factor G [Bacillota bacterium]
MRKYKPEEIRNIALVGHSGSGKTTLAEIMLFAAKATDRLGRVDDGTSVMDHDPEEIKRKVSVSTAIAPCEWKNRKINIVDTPGFFDFIGEVKSALRIVESAVVVVDASGGVQVGTEKVWSFAEESGLARIIVVNKLERENTNFAKVLADLQNRFGVKVIPVQLPIGSEDKFNAVVDLISLKAYTTEGGKTTETAIPEDLKAQVDEYRAMLVEAAAEGDDDLLAKFFDDQPLTQEEVTKGLSSGIKQGRVFPVLCASAHKGVGISALLDFMADFLPSSVDGKEITGVDKNGAAITRKPSENEAFSALVFKTMADPFVGKLTLLRAYSGTLKSDSSTYNINKDRVERIGQLFVVKGKSQEPVTEIAAGDMGAVAKLQETSTGDTLTDKDNAIRLEGIVFPAPKLSMAVEPKAKGDEEKIGTGLARLTEEDPTFTVSKDPDTHETLVSGLGDQHLEVITSRLSKKFGVEVTLKTPRVPYKETIRGNVRVEGKHKKQSGGRGQYGHCWIEMEPTEAEFEFVDKIFGGSVPRQYIPAIEKGIREQMDDGVLAGYPVTGVKVTLVDGSYHTVDSSEMAFKIAGSLAFKKGFAEASPTLLEPIVTVAVTVPDEFMGDIIGDLNKKRGRIMGMEPIGHGMQMVKAQAPKAEMFQYAIDLRSMTQGRADYTLEFDHYEEVPANIKEKVIAESAKAKEE